MGSAVYPLAKTPDLDALAARGTRFTNSYTICPICVLARASFATGRYRGLNVPLEPTPRQDPEASGGLPEKISSLGWCGE